MVEMNKSGILKAKDFACYIKNKYREYSENTKEISPIKIQKALYFCFAYWAGFVKKGIIDQQIDKDENEILFDDRIEAWSFGPVVPNVYFKERDSSTLNSEDEEETIKQVETILNDKLLLRETIDSILQDIFETSDFKLVSRSHMDKCWQNHYNASSEKHNEEIPKKEIVNEYTTKEFN